MDPFSEVLNFTPFNETKKIKKKNDDIKAVENKSEENREKKKTKTKNEDNIDKKDKKDKKEKNKQINEKEG